MTAPTKRTFLILAAVFFSAFIIFRYFLSFFLPFLLGAGLALAAEPAVGFLQKKVRLPRAAAAGVGVSLVLSILAAVLVILGGLAVRWVESLAGILPQVRDIVQGGLLSLQDWLLGLAGRAPDGLSAFLTDAVLELFSGGTALLSRLTDTLLGLATGFLTRIPDGALTVATCLIAGFMISAKLPRIRRYLRLRIPPLWRSRYLPALQAAKSSVGSWLKAQLKLTFITMTIVTAGLLILRIRYAPVWGLCIAAVDAVPLLGTGTVMVPWALICLLQGRRARCLGLLAIYLLAALARSFLEPRLVGRQMGMDPLLTLGALYLGYRLWGIGGMLLSPILAATAIGLAKIQNPSEKQPHSSDSSRL